MVKYKVTKIMTRSNFIEADNAEEAVEIAEMHPEFFLVGQTTTWEAKLEK